MNRRSKNAQFESDVRLVTAGGFVSASVPPMLDKLSIRSTMSLIEFDTIVGNEAHNISAPFQYMGEWMIAGELPMPHAPADSGMMEVVFFTNMDRTQPNHWTALLRYYEFHRMSEPCVTRINGKVCLGGLRYIAPGRCQESHMEFYLETDQEEFVYAFSGAAGVRDIRLLQLSDERVLVMATLKGLGGERGHLAYFIADSFEQLNEQCISKSMFVEELQGEAESIVAKDLHLLSNGMVGVLASKRIKDCSGMYHEYAVTFCLNLHSGEITEPEILATRSDFPLGLAPAPQAQDLLKPGGMLRMGDGCVCLYAEICDVNSGVIEVVDPFLPIESPETGLQGKPTHPPERRN